MHVLFRADAGAEIGVGHVMRCFALAQHVQEENGEVAFACASLPASLRERFVNEGMVVREVNVEPGSAEEAHRTTRLIQEMESEWVVADGYAFGGDYQRHLKESGVGILTWDDHGHADHYHADFVLNQNISANILMYEAREPHTRLLLGTEYVVLRRAFRAQRGIRERKQPATARRLLVTLGGGDPCNATVTVLEALEVLDVSDLEVRVVIGSTNPHEVAIRETAGRSRHDVTVLQDVKDMANLMAWAEVAVSAGGSTCWELAFASLPNIIVVIAENQRDIARGLEEAGVSVNAGWHRDVTVADLHERIALLLPDFKRRVAMTRAGRRIVDGKGGKRVLRALQGKPQAA